MTDNVLSLTGAPIADGMKQQFIDTLAQAYDLLTELGEPVAVVFALVSKTGAVRSGYHCREDIADSNTLHLSRAFMALQADAVEIAGRLL